MNNANGTKLGLMGVALAVVLSAVTGCASTGATQASAANTTPQANGNVKWETVSLADGVEIRLNEDAGPEARRVVEQIQSEMRSRYLGAR